MMIRTTYERVTLTGVKQALCSGCGKKLRRQRTFGQTLNPWNKNPDGTLKTRRDIHAALKTEIAAWQPEPETCRQCAQ